MTRADPTERISEVTWEIPQVRTHYDWPLIAATLRERPMEWAKIFDTDRTSVVNALRQGKIECVRPDLGFEVTTTNNKRDRPRTCSLYMRWNPEKEDDLSAVLSASRKER